MRLMLTLLLTLLLPNRVAIDAASSCGALSTLPLPNARITSAQALGSIRYGVRAQSLEDRQARIDATGGRRSREERGTLL